MRCIRLNTKDPYFCLAAEEYLMKKFTDDIFMLWQSDDTVVIGKHQNAMGEINYRYIHGNNIRVARRISGGGTVFHDSGNLNFAYIKNVDSPSEISFGRFIQPVIEALAILGIEAGTSGRNDLLVEGKKISGNAQHIFKNRVLHHGTLLFDSNLDTLGNAIRIVPGKYQGKAVQSKRSIVTNILPHLKEKMTLEEFTLFMLDFELARDENTEYTLTEEDIRTIQKSADDKFSTWEWNYGYSPKYTFQNQDILGGKLLNVQLQVEKGHITGATITGNHFSAEVNDKLAAQLTGIRHSHDDVVHALSHLKEGTPEEVIAVFF